MISTRLKLLRTTALSAGLLGMTLRTLLYATAIDHKGLLIAGHWATWSILILTGLVLILMLAISWKAQGPSAYEDCFPRSFFQGTTSLLVAGIIAMESIPLFSTTRDILGVLTSVFGVASGAAMLVVAICRFFGKRPFFLCHSILCVFFALHMVSQYRHWSSDPQLMNYGFYLVAFICLMLTSYFLAGFDANMVNRRALWFFSMAAAYFCCLAMPESGEAALLIACALWAFFSVPKCQARVSRHSAPAAEETEHADS